MKVIFYDKRNRQEISSDQLIKINLRETKLSIDNQGYQDGTPLQTLMDNFGKDSIKIYSDQIGSIGYKSKICPGHMNWDRWLNESDLIFLRLESE